MLSLQCLSEEHEKNSRQTYWKSIIRIDNMAKKKAKKKAQPQQFMSPEKFLKERMRSVPIGKCYVSENYEKTGVANVIVSRVHTGGRVSFAVYLMDLWCLGVKECFYHLRVEDYEFKEEVLERSSRMTGIREISYNEAHNLVYGALAFAEEAGIAPCKEFALGQYFLEEDTEDIPLIEYEFGKDGKYYLMARNELELSTYLPVLKKNLLEDQYGFMILEPNTFFNKDDDDDDDFDDYIDDDDDYELVDSDFYGYNRRPYTYSYQSLPSTLELKRPRILEIFQEKDNWLVVSKEQRDEILSIPKEELREDLENIIRYGIHAMVGEDGEFDEKAAEIYGFPVSHAAMFLGEVGNETSSLNALLDTLRMPDDAVEWLYGDGIDMTVSPSIVKLAPRAISAIASYLMEEGVVNSFKSYVMTALVNVAHYFPEAKEEVLSVFHRFLTRALEEKQEALFTDYCLNGMLVCSLLDIQAKEFLPEIEELYNQDLADKMCAGSWKEVKRDMLGWNTFTPLDIDLDKRCDGLIRAFGHNRR